ncbi:hypothetical protein F5Y02DRAFT_402671 [Annulohypoxylon stygium]|nr:hypothetical protein F5Y02DRAFT_402671 [Annulohypoxylon stygium]
MSQLQYLMNLLESSTESSTRSPPVVDSTPHSGINSDQLRLLQPVLIHSDSLHFSVSTVSRFSAPPYTAVSYTWGDDDATETIYLDGKPFQVRPNLWSKMLPVLLSGWGRYHPESIILVPSLGHPEILPCP